MRKITAWLIAFTLLLSATPKSYAAQKPLSVSAASAIVMDAATREILFEKEIDTPRSMASTTKIMTTLLLLEQGNLQETVTATMEGVQVEGTAMGLAAGDKITREGLCYGMMLSSGNDAANLAAIVHSGNLENFENAMNQKAAALGMNNSHFVTPSGLDHENHYSTAYDMALLTAHALENPAFAQIAKTTKKVVEFGNPPTGHTLTNHNRLLNEYEGCIGVKTGFTKKSGRCLVTAATRNGATLICVTLKAPNDWQDHKALLDYGFSLMESVTHPQNTFAVPLAGGKEQQVEVSHQALTLSLPSRSKEELTFRIAATPFLYAPIAKGQQVGQLQAVYKGKVIKAVPLFAQNACPIYVPQIPFWQRFWENFFRFFP